MKRTLAATALMATMALAGCGNRQAAETAEAAATPAADEAAPAAEALAPAAVASAAERADPAASGAPAFAVLYPGAKADGPATMAQGPVGPGGIVSFTTEASPETVIAFYRSRADAGGLKPITAMNQGKARAYSAGDGANGSGKLLSVVATPVEDGTTSVQLSWTAGR
jgi:hypothetical protein